MVAIANLLNPESAATVTLPPKDAERLVSKVATQAGQVMFDAGYAVLIAARSGLSNARMAEIFGKATSTITLYRRLGLYLVMVGGKDNVDPDTWRILSGKSKANDKRIGAVIEAEGATGKAVEDAVREHFTPDGKARNAPPATPKVTGTGDGNVPPLDEARILVKRLRVLHPSLAGEEWAEIETALHEIVTEHVAAVTANAKSKAKPKAPAKASA